MKYYILVLGIVSNVINLRGCEGEGEGTLTLITTGFRLFDSTMVYPSYSGYTTEFIPQRRSLIQVARTTATTSNIQLIPMDTADLYNEKT
jgi:hypothetical protein